MTKQLLLSQNCINSKAPLALPSAAYHITTKETTQTVYILLLLKALKRCIIGPKGMYYGLHIFGSFLFIDFRITKKIRSIKLKGQTNNLCC